MKTGNEQKAKENEKARKRALARWETDGGKIPTDSALSGVSGGPQRDVKPPGNIAPRRK